MSVDFSEDTRGQGFILSCCNPCQSLTYKGDTGTHSNGKPQLNYYRLGGTPGPLETFLSTCTPFVIFAWMSCPIALSHAKNFKLSIFVGTDANGQPEIAGELRTKTACDETTETFNGIRGADMDKTLWTTVHTHGARRNTSRHITYQLELTLMYGKKTVDIDQALGERACREINELLQRFAPHTMLPPTQQVMLLNVPQIPQQQAQVLAPLTMPTPGPMVPQAMQSMGTTNPSAPMYAQQRM